MQERCRRHRVIRADPNGVGRDMLAHAARNRIIQARGVVRSVRLSSRPVSGQFQPRAQQMVDLDGRNLRHTRIQLVRHKVIRQSGSVRQRKVFLNLQRHGI